MLRLICFIYQNLKTKLTAKQNILHPLLILKEIQEKETGIHYHRINMS